MTSIAEFTLPAAEFPLGRALDDHPGLRFELDRVVPAADTVMPYFWVIGTADMESVQSTLSSLPELRSARLMEDLGDAGLFRAEWDPDSLGIMSVIAETDVTVVSADGSTDGWVFELRAERTDAFSEFDRRCGDLALPARLTRLTTLSRSRTGSEYDLTPEQREALVLAYEAGYYDDPRGTDLESLAARLGISRPAFSERLRRGYRNLVESTLIAAPDE